MKKNRIIIALLMALMMAVLTCCAQPAGSGEGTADSGSAAESEAAQEDAGDGQEGEAAEKNGGIMILFTSDIHCGIEEGFGFAGLQAIRNKLESDGYVTILVDNGDAIQGDAVGIMTRGEAIVDLMNAVKYDVAIPGNYEFNYSVDRFLELTARADFPYICCNFSKNGELVLPAYVIKEAGGKKIAFVGITTPETLIKAPPTYFQDDSGKYIYSFAEGGEGQDLYTAVQNAVDAARAEGADYVYALGHLGMLGSSRPWTYADVIENTSGIDVFLDGHSHDTERVEMKNKDGKKVVRCAVGTKLQSIGYSEISPEGVIRETDAWAWTNSKSAPELFGFDSPVQGEIDKVRDNLEEQFSQIVGKADIALTIYDPEEKFEDGSPVRMVRRAETNLGDFFADAIRTVMEADIGFANGGGIRTDIPEGDLTYEKLLNVYPFNNEICVLEITGQQIIDALEWGVRSEPDENGGFLQVSGLTYEIDVNVPTPCKTNKSGAFSGIEGKRRVRNVKVGDAPIDPDAYYKVAGNTYMMQEGGDGFAMFKDPRTIINNGKLDSEVIIEYIRDHLNGEIGTGYTDPHGEGRITVIQ